MGKYPEEDFLMGWQEVRMIEQRMKFVIEVHEGNRAFSEVCRRYGISRKTGCKRYLHSILRKELVAGTQHFSPMANSVSPRTKQAPVKLDNPRFLRLPNSSSVLTNEDANLCK